MKIELFHTPGCAKCSTATAALRSAAEAAVPDVEWCEVNVLDALERAVDLGVLTLPAQAGGRPAASACWPVCSSA